MMPHAPSCHRVPCGGRRAASTLVLIALVSTLAGSSCATNGHPAASDPGWTGERRCRTITLHHAGSAGWSGLETASL